MSEILSQLKQDTQELHQQTEEVFYSDALKNGTITREQYEHLLQTHLAFHRALEQSLARIPDYPLEERRKQPWLEADLKALNASAIQKEVADLQQWTPEDLLGAAYVAEGSMLGGQVIKRWLQAHPELGAYAGDSRFYEGYGKSTGERWKSFREYLTAKADSYDPDKIVAGAKKAFKLYQEVFTAIA